MQNHRLTWFLKQHLHWGYAHYPPIPDERIPLVSSAQSPRMARFGPFELDLRTGELTRGGRHEKLALQPAQLLIYLINRQGDLVTREELRSQLWPEDTFVDFDHGVNNAVNRIREVLRDSATAPKYVQTVPRRGYRFIGQLEAVPTPDISAAPENPQLQEANNPEPPPRRGWIWISVALAVALIAGLLLRRTLSFSSSNIRTIAVLPFANLSGDSAQDYFADAMTEELTSDLGKISALRVISRTSAMHYKKTSKTMPEIAQELNVDGVIEGSVVRSGDRVRITAQLINARTDRHLWSESYERDLKDVLALQSELARGIASQVRAVVTEAEADRLHSESVGPAALDAYMRGRLYVDRWSSEDSAQALHYFQLATELDNNYALAYVGMAECYIYGVAGVSNEEGLKRGFAVVTRALELKPDMGEAHAMLGFLRAERDWDFAGAEAEMKKGIALSPNYAAAHHWYSHLLLYLGRFDEAMVETRKLIELDPVSPTPSGHLAYQYLASRQWDLAIAQFNKALAEYKNALAEDPSQIDEYSELGEAYLGKHMYKEAIAEMSRAVELSRTSAQYPFYLARLGNARAQAGDIAGAKKILAELPADDPYDAAYVYAGLGDRDKSIALLNEAYRRHTFLLDAGHRVELDPLRSDPRFIELLQRIHLRQ